MTIRATVLSPSDRHAALVTKLRIHGLYDRAVTLAARWQVSVDDLFHARRRSAIRARVDFAGQLRTLGWSDERIDPFLGERPLRIATTTASP